MSGLRFQSFSSGSAGNCYFLGTPDGRGVLIDAGASIKRIRTELSRSGLGLDSVEAVLVTHDHLDHIRHLGAFCKKLGKPVYACRDLHDALSVHSFTREYIASCCRVLEADRWNEVAGMQVRYFSVPHDASSTCGYAIVAGGLKFVIMTDAGRVTPEALSLFRQADIAVIESNYDVDMLMGGHYPHELKMRICGGHGHLSNDECAEAVRGFFHPGMKAIFLCHLSENNNTPEAAYRSASGALESIGAGGGEVLLKPLPRTLPSAMYSF